MLTHKLFYPRPFSSPLPSQSINYILARITPEMLTRHTLRRVLMRHIISLVFVARPYHLFGTLRFDISVHHNFFVIVFLEEKERGIGRKRYICVR
jgi:hypothetical protein